MFSVVIWHSLLSIQRERTHRESQVYEKIYKSLPPWWTNREIQISKWQQLPLTQECQRRLQEEDVLSWTWKSLHMARVVKES